MSEPPKVSLEGFAAHLLSDPCRPEHVTLTSACAHGVKHSFFAYDEESDGYVMIGQCLLPNAVPTNPERH